MSASHTDTIAALSTPPGESGIAVVRVCGEAALDILSRVVRSTAGNSFELPWEHRRIYRARFVDGAGEPVDDVMAAVMRAPETYTGDDTVEFSCHGGMAVVARVLETLFTAGVRPAEPGEFTRRAFLNGKIDLIQAEAVADLIHARTELQRMVAERQLRGALSERIEALASSMLELLGLIEANIDFIEEGIDALDVPATVASITRQCEQIDDLLATASFARPLRDGYQVVIAGPVNAGKSSLFNYLLGESRAIVTEIPGTTRDVLRETISLDGVPFVIHDTAGLRDDTGDPVESIGMDRARAAVNEADIVVLVVDGSSPDAERLREATENLDAARSVVLINKRDLGFSMTMPDLRGIATICGSAVSGEGIDELRAALRRLAGTDALTRAARERTVLNRRLATLLESARVGLTELACLVGASTPLEILAVKAREVLSYYEEATGRRYHDGLLDVIFSRFCIGK
jgi:tRNA modification GTPase